MIFRFIRALVEMAFHKRAASSHSNEIISVNSCHYVRGVGAPKDAMTSSTGALGGLMKDKILVQHSSRMVTEESTA